MIISGYVINYDKFSLNNRLKILIPFFIFGIINTILRRQELLHFMMDIFKSGYWFLWVLIIFSLFLFLIRILKLNIIFGSIIVETVFLILLYFIHGSTFESIISLYFLWRLWPFFSLGVMMKDKNWFDWIKRKAKIIFILCILTFTIALYLSIHLDLFVCYMTYKLQFLIALPICLLLMLTFYYAEQNSKGKYFPCKSYLKKMGNDIGTNTLQIYVLHYFILDLLKLQSFGQYMIANNMVWLELIVSPILALMIAYACICISKLVYKMHIGIVFGV
jgi:fucose 4-O-acetylase-like acetyltransferase